MFDGMLETLEETVAAVQRRNNIAAELETAATPGVCMHV
jgi:hypothetical protein